MLVKIIQEGSKFYIKTPEGNELDQASINTLQGDTLNSEPMDSFLVGQNEYQTSEHGVYFSTMMPQDIYDTLSSIANKTQVDLDHVIFDILRDWIGAE